MTSDGIIKVHGYKEKITVTCPASQSITSGESNNLQLNKHILEAQGK